MKKTFDFETIAGKVIKYIKIGLIAVLIITALLACMEAGTTYMNTDSRARVLIIIIMALCCLALIILEAISIYMVKNFKQKMVFFSFDCLLLIVITVISGNSLLVILYCIVLTECYMTLDKFADKLIIFLISCGLFIITFVIGWIMVNNGASVWDSFMEIFTGCIYGLLAMLIDFIVVDFLMAFYKNNVELSHALKEAEESRKQLHEAYTKLAESSIYEERNRIARDIHDNAGHSITAVIMQTEAAKVNIDTDPEQAKRSIIAANMQAKNALEQMRASVHLLAGRTDGLTLKTDIEQIIMETTDGTDIKVRSDLDNVDVSEGMYRYVSSTVKECLANGLRHGGATAFYIELKEEDGMLHLLVSDNGSGIAGGITDGTEGYGLKGMRENAAKFGGTCTFTTEEDDGFETDIYLPLNRVKGTESGTATGTSTGIVTGADAGTGTRTDTGTGTRADAGTDTGVNTSPDSIQQTQTGSETSTEGSKAGNTAGKTE